MTATVRTVETENQFGDSCLTCARLTDETESFADTNLQRNVVDYMYCMAVLCERLRQVINIE